MNPRYHPAHVRVRRRQQRRRRAISVVVLLVLLAVGKVESAGSIHRYLRTAVTSTPPGRAPHVRRRARTKRSPGTTSTTTPAPSSDVLTSGTIASYLSGQSGDVTATLYDVDTGTTSTYRPGVTEYTASIVKVDILASDLWDDTGTANGLAAFNTLLALHDTVPDSGPYWGGTQTTASDQVSLLRAIVQGGPALDPTSRQYELSLMENIEPDQAWGVSAGVPSGLTLALKNGWLPLEADGDWQVNSIGWIDGDGRGYLLAVLTKDDADEQDGIDTIQGLSQLVWKAEAPAA